MADVPKKTSEQETPLDDSVALQEEQFRKQEELLSKIPKEKRDQVMALIKEKNELIGMIPLETHDILEAFLEELQNERPDGSDEDVYDEDVEAAVGVLEEYYEKNKDKIEQELKDAQLEVVNGTVVKIQSLKDVISGTQEADRALDPEEIIEKLATYGIKAEGTTTQDILTSIESITTKTKIEELEKQMAEISEKNKKIREEYTEARNAVIEAENEKSPELEELIKERDKKAMEDKKAKEEQEEFRKKAGVQFGLWYAINAAKNELYQKKVDGGESLTTEESNANRLALGEVIKMKKILHLVDDDSKVLTAAEVIQKTANGDFDALGELRLEEKIETQTYAVGQLDEIIQLYLSEKSELEEQRNKLDEESNRLEELADSPEKEEALADNRRQKEQIEREFYLLQEEAISSYGTWLGGITAIEQILDEKKQKGEVSPEEEAKLADIKKFLEEIKSYAKLYEERDELRKKNNEKPVSEWSQEDQAKLKELEEKIENDETERVRLHKYHTIGQQKAELKPEESIPIPEQLYTGKEGDEYKVQEIKEYKEKIEGEGRLEEAQKVVTTIYEAYKEKNVPESSLKVIQLMLWRHASNNPNLSVDKPFLAHDISTQQALIYFPGNPVEIVISRAFHGVGPVGNVDKSRGTSLGSKALKVDYKGGDYKHRVEVDGLEAANANDRARLIRIHEKDGGATWGCTGLPTAVAKKFADAVEAAGGGAQETFISNGEAMPEDWGKHTRQSLDQARRAGSGDIPNFSNSAEVQAFLDKVKRNPFLRLMLVFLAPLGLMMAKAEGNEMMIEFWEGILGYESDKDSVSGGGDKKNTRGTNRPRSGGSPESYRPGGSIHAIGEAIYNNEARVDADGNPVVYKLPPEDGGGTYEVAGINDKYHPQMAARLKKMIEDGNAAEAKEVAINHILDVTTETNQVVSKNLGVEAFMRDSAFNRGGSGSANIAARALKELYPDNKDIVLDGSFSDAEQELWTRAESENVNGLIDGLRTGREAYERTRKDANTGRLRDEKSTFWEGLKKRWDTMAQYARDNSDKVIPLPTEYKESPTEHDVRVLHSGDPEAVLGELNTMIDIYETHGGGVLPHTHTGLREIVEELEALEANGVDKGSEEYQKKLYAATSLANYMDVHNKAVPYSFPPVTGSGTQYARACGSLSDCIVETSNTALQNLHRELPDFQSSSFNEAMGFNGRKSYSAFFKAMEQSGAGRKVSWNEAMQMDARGEIVPGLAMVSIRGGGHGGLLLPGGYMVDSSSKYKSNGSAIGERKLDSAHEVLIVEKPQALYDYIQANA